MKPYTVDRLSELSSDESPVMNILCCKLHRITNILILRLLTGKNISTEKDAVEVSNQSVHNVLDANCFFCLACLFHVYISIMTFDLLIKFET